MRQLAAIMFTDIVGYTALMQSDEQRAMAVRKRHRSVFETTHEQYNGRIIQYFGDGTLSLFSSAVEATKCAAEIQKMLRTNPVEVPLRIGIHLGDVFFDGTEVYGDGVNIASRIEQISETGSVFLSESVQKELNNQPDIATISLGIFHFKNVQNPVQVYALSVPEVVTPPTVLNANSAKFAEKTVAVLPFNNLSGDPTQDFICDGITEEVITALSKVHGLKVTSRTSSFYFKNTNLPSHEIGAALGVSTLVIGSIRVSGNIMRITAQLIDVEDDYCFWSDKIDRSKHSIFEVQDEISLAIAERLREHLGHLEINRSLVITPQISVDNYSEYLRARYLLLTMNTDAIRKGMEILQQVVHSEPNYAFAHLGLHMGYTLLGTLGIKPALEAYTEGQKYLAKAIELDPDIPDCRLQQAWVSFLQDWDLDATYQHLQKVRESAQIVDYYQTMASVLVVEREFKAASNYINQALKLDPFSEITHHLRGFIYYVQSEFKNAIISYQKSKALRPESGVSELEYGQSLILLNRFDEALLHFTEMPELIDPIVRRGGIALALLAVNKTDQAQDHLEFLHDSLNSEQIERALQFLILVEALQENFDKVYEYLQKAFAMRLPMLLYMKIDPMLRKAYAHEGCKQILDKIAGSSKKTELIEEKYQQVLIEPEQLPHFRNAVISLMEKRQLFLDPYLKLNDLAEHIELSANQLSQLLNAGFNQNFSEFVNTYRINFFKQLVRNKEHEQLTILALAYKSGFNSKTSFNTFFKKVEGISPRVYLKSVRT